MSDKPDRFEDEHEAKCPVCGQQPMEEWCKERPIVWPVGAKIPVKDVVEEEMADADATLEARASRSNPEE